MRIGLTRYKNRGFQLRMIRANRFARIDSRIARATKLFDNFRAGQKTSKIVKKCQKVFRHFSTIFAWHHFSGPLLGGSENRRFVRTLWSSHHRVPRKGARGVSPQGGFATMER